MTAAGGLPFVEEAASLESWETDGGRTAARPTAGPDPRRAIRRHEWRRMVPGMGTAAGLAIGAALGSTVFENLALATGIGLVLGAVVDLRHPRTVASVRMARWHDLSAGGTPECNELVHDDDE